MKRAWLTCSPGSVCFALGLFLLAPASCRENQDNTNPDAVKATAVSVGAGESCALRGDGLVKCWGQLGNQESLVPTFVYGLEKARAISVGGEACALRTDGSVYCQGYLNSGTVAGITTAVSLSVGRSHACVVLGDGTIRCWGDNMHGQLGTAPSLAPEKVPVAVPAIGNAVMVSAGGEHTCALLADGSVQCWGGNSLGQLGNDQMDSSNVPVPISGISNATSVSAGSSHTCARLADGTIQCWGDNTYGQLGNRPLPEGWIGGSIQNNPGSAVPVPVAGITDASAVSCFYGHCCALLSGGSLACWGMDGSGEVGSPSVTTCYYVESPRGMEGAPIIATGTLCAPVPVPVTGIDEVIAVSAGVDSTCAVRRDGSVSCWGGNKWGQLGNGTSVDSPTPVRVTGF